MDTLAHATEATVPVRHPGCHTKPWWTQELTAAAAAWVKVLGKLCHQENPSLTNSTYLAELH